MTIAVLPGSFDPVTLGHVDIATRAASLFEHLIVAVAHNSAKTPMLDLDTRLALASGALKHLPNVSVEATGDLLVEFCKARGAAVIVKGLRGGADYDYERPMALMNRSLTGIETVFITGDSALAHVASSLVRDVARHGGDVSAYVPAGVAESLRNAG